MLKTKGRVHVGSIEIAKSTKLEINVVRHENDKDYVDVRTWFANVYAGGAWTPTKKGVHIPIEKVDALMAELRAAMSFDPAKLTMDAKLDVD